MMRMRLPTFRLSGLMAMIVVAGLVLVSLRYASAPWAGTILLLTTAILCWAILAAVYRRGAARAFWLGFAVFVWGYAGLLMSGRPEWESSQIGDLPTSRLLSSVHAYLDPPNQGGGIFGGGFLPKSGPAAYLDQFFTDAGAPNRKIRAVLKEPISLHFARETALEDVIRSIKAATIRPGLPYGLFIYVEPSGLQEAEQTMGSPILFEMDGLPLGTALKTLLRQLDLMYRIGDGMLTITSNYPNDSVFEPDAYHRIGHCWWAWVAGVIGGGAARYLRASSLKGREPLATTGGV